MKLKNITKTYNLECTNETGYVKILIMKINKECVLTIPFEDSKQFFAIIHITATFASRQHNFGEDYAFLPEFISMKNKMFAI